MIRADQGRIFRAEFVEFSQGGRTLPELRSSRKTKGFTDGKTARSDLGERESRWGTPEGHVGFVGLAVTADQTPYDEFCFTFLADGDLWNQHQMLPPAAQFLRRKKLLSGPGWA